MLRTLVAPVSLGLLLFSSAGPAAPQDGPQVIATVGGPIKFEPVLIHDVVGGTLTGAVHTHLTVYNNGFMTVAKFHDVVFPAPGTDKDVATASLSPAEVQQLQADLRASGAFGLPDQEATGADIPLTTMTVFRGATDAKAHTFSYLMGTSPYAAAQDVVDQLMADHFPGF
ncbi:MAG: hypothetical protein P1V81_12980 [Planctomycetota bacterium]|nr:hypothetical protein [Planctomycetota bacterium]